jgi:hypothetical protein
MGDIVDVVLAYMPESIFRLVGMIPMSGIQLVQRYKRVTDELAQKLVVQHGDNNGDESSFVSHLCMLPF